MKLVFPNLELKEQYYELVKSALKNGDIFEIGMHIVKMKNMKIC